MRSLLVEVGFVLGQDLVQVHCVEDERSVEHFAAYAADPPFHDRVHARCLGGRPMTDRLVGDNLFTYMY